MNRFLYILLFSLCLAHFSHAENFIIADVDGTVESYAALATLLRSSSGPSLKMVSVSGTTWGFPATVERDVCRFLNGAGRGTVQVALGATSSVEDTYSSSTKHGECQAIQGFPLTPVDATRRGMPYSRADVTSAFSATSELPLTEGCGKTTDAKTAMLKLFRQMKSTDTLTFLSLGSTVTTLAEVVEGIQQEGDVIPLMTMLKERASIHLYEPGYAGGADALAMQRFLSYSLPLSLYPPVFFSAATTFTTSYWASFTAIAKQESAPFPVRWVNTAWSGKRSRVGERVFHAESGPAASLVVLCAIDTVLLTTCHNYRAKVGSLSFNWTKGISGTPLAIDGLNVTRNSFYTMGDAPVNNTGSGSLYVYTLSATEPLDDGRTLKEAFWSRWLDLLQ